VRVLLDECLPRRLKLDLIGHDVMTVSEMGWAGTKDDQLLRLAAPTFDALNSIDKGFPLVARRTGSRLTLVLLRARTNRLADLRPLMPEVLRWLAGARGGETIDVPPHE